MGLGLSLPVVSLALALPDSEAKAVLAAVMGCVVGIYVGFSLVDGRVAQLRIQLGFALFILLLTALSLLVSPLLLGLSYALHGCWDLLHLERRPLIPTRLPGWYAFFCMTFDFPVALAVLWRWL